MPNWCSNSVAVYSKDKEQVELFRSKYLEALKASTENNHWGTYELFVVHGYSHDFIMSDKSDWIRGPLYDNSNDDMHINYLEDKNLYYFYLYFESAWGPMIDGFNLILNNKYKDLRAVFCCEECSEGCYVNTDIDHIFFTDKYCTYDDEEDGSMYFETDDEVISYFKDKFNIDIDLSELADDDCIDIDDDRSVNFYRFTNY